MSTITLVHGTSANRVQKIFKNGFDCEKVVWNCSDPDYTYFYQVDKFVKAEGYDEGYTLQEQIEQTVMRANESAQITSAIEKNPQDHTVVFEITINCDNEEEMEEFLDYIYPDRSCKNMENAGAVCVENEVINKWLKSDKVKVTIHEFEFFPKLALAYLSPIVKNEWFQDTLDYLPSEEVKMLHILAQNGLFIEELFYPSETVSYTAKF